MTVQHREELSWVHCEERMAVFHQSHFPDKDLNDLRALSGDVLSCVSINYLADRVKVQIGWLSQLQPE